LIVTSVVRQMNRGWPSPSSMMTIVQILIRGSFAHTVF
jgi:hypothetical protein